MEEMQKEENDKGREIETRKMESRQDELSMSKNAILLTGGVR